MRKFILATVISSSLFASAIASARTTESSIYDSKDADDVAAMYSATRNASTPAPATQDIFASVESYDVGAMYGASRHQVAEEHFRSIALVATTGNLGALGLGNTQSEVPMFSADPIPGGP
jgi:hypothetical protein